ncbi:36355_t:CDS:1, partial [Gigaspora margarita]
GLHIYGSQFYGYTQDLYEMEYFKPFYIARKIGSIRIFNNDITKLDFILWMMWAFKERMALANELWSTLPSHYENDIILESSDNGDNYDPKKPSKCINQHNFLIEYFIILRLQFFIGEYFK